MRLSKRSNGIWLLDYVDERGNRRRISTGTRNREDAEKEAQRIMSGRSKRHKQETITLATCLWDTYDRIWSHQKSANATRVRIAALARGRLGATPVEHIDYRMLNEWAMEHLRAGRKPATVNRKLAAIGKALGEAVKMGNLGSKPPMPHFREDNAKLRWLTQHEEDALLVACHILREREASTMRHLIHFLVDTGARLSEALKVAGEVGTVAVFTDTKNGSSRKVPLTARAHRAMPFLPQTWNTDKCTKLFSRVRDEAMLPDVTLHTLRHTCASRLVQGGMDLYRVKTWLGHSNITVTERYAHLAPSSLNEGAEILGTSGHTSLRLVQ